MKRLIVGLVVLAGLLVAVDFGAAAVTEAAVSRQMRQEIGLPRDPAVRINGFPFLSQAAGGHYAGIDITADRLTVGPLREVEVVARMVDVTAPGGLGSGLTSAQVRRLESTVRVGANDLESLVGDVERMRVETVDEDLLEETVEDGGDPTLSRLDPDDTARLVGTVVGLPLPGDDADTETEIAVIVALDMDADGRVQLIPRDVRQYGESEPFAADVAGPLAERFTITVEPGALPLGVTPRTVRAVDGVLQISGVARNLTLGAPPATAG